LCLTYEALDSLCSTLISPVSVDGLSVSPALSDVNTSTPSLAIHPSPDAIIVSAYAPPPLRLVPDSSRRKSARVCAA